MESFLVLILFTVVVLFVLYWVVRLAVSHGVQDAARKQQKTPAQAQPR